MPKQTLPLPKKWPVLFFICLSGILIINGCRKKDFQPEKNLMTELESKFFNSHTSAEPLIQGLAKFVQRRNQGYNSVEKIVTRIGFPYWDKAISVLGNSSSSIGASQETLTFIPFVRDSQNYVNASLIIRSSPTDTTFNYLCDWQYSSFDEDTAGWNALNVFHLFARLDNAVFNRTKFRIKDENLVPQQIIDSLDNAGTSFDSVQITYTLSPSQQMTGGNSLWTLVTWCDDIGICIPQLNQVAGRLNTLNPIVPSHGCSGMILVVSVCTSTWEYITSSGGGGTGGGEPGGGSGGGSGNGSTPPDCPGSVNPLQSSLTDDPCEPGWVPIDNPTLEELLQQWDDNIIIDPSVRQCIIDVFNKVKNLREGNIAGMIYILSQQIPGFDWKIVESPQSTIPNADAATDYSPSLRLSTTYLNWAKLQNATNISLARTIMHEAIHAFIYDYVYNKSSLTQAQKDQILALPFSKKLKEFIRIKYPDDQNDFHNLMAGIFVNSIKDALKLLCPEFGINLSPVDLETFCADMAWGGLQDDNPTSPWSQLLTSEDRARINKRLEIELNNLPGFSGYVPVDGVNHYVSLTRVGTKACP